MTVPRTSHAPPESETTLAARASPHSLPTKTSKMDGFLNRYGLYNPNPPYRPFDGNQGTYLTMAMGSALIITLVAALGPPLIPEISFADVSTSAGNGTIRMGGLGFCLDGEGLDEQLEKCASYTVFSGNDTIAALPEALWGIHVPEDAVSGEWKIASVVMHALGVVVAWMAASLACTASGEWHQKKVGAWIVTRFAWWMSMASLVTSAVPWALNIAALERLRKGARAAEGFDVDIKVKAGPAIYMASAAVFINLAAFIVRLTWSRRQSRPLWTVKGQESDFHHDPALPRPGPHGDGNGDGNAEADAAYPLSPHGDRTLLDPRPSFATTHTTHHLAVPGPGAGAGMGGWASKYSPFAAYIGDAHPEAAQTHTQTGVPANEDEPPSWESLNLDSAIRAEDKYWPSARGMDEKR